MLTGWPLSILPFQMHEGVLDIGLGLLGVQIPQRLVRMLIFCFSWFRKDLDFINYLWPYLLSNQKFLKMNV